MAARSRNARRHGKTHVAGLVVLGVLAAIVAAIGAFIVGGFQLADSWLENLPDYTDTDAYLVSEPTRVLDADGNLIGEFYLQNRQVIGPDEVSPWVLEGIVATEDERFYEHKGVDLQGIGRAATVMLSSGQAREGGSTITQQLVRNTVLSEEQFDVTLRRKVREAYIALQLEKMFSKEEILMMYVNTIYFGGGAYGVEAASQTFFNKPSKDLTLAEAAVIAGLPQSPSRLDPSKNPEGATERRNTVLRRMLTNNKITQAQYDEAVAAPLEIDFTKQKESGAIKYPYFVDMVKKALLEEYPQSLIFQGGLTVHTTISPFYQDAAEEAVADTLANANDRTEIALASVDPKTGYVLAIVGGKDHSTDQFNLATQARRQPGSSFKTFTLAAAINAGVSPDTTLNANSPVQVTPNWAPKNFGNASYGNVSLKEATWNSYNTAYGLLAHEIGAQSIVDMAHTMGIKSELAPYDSITLGVSGVSPLEMASAYGTLATTGTQRDPVIITQILDKDGDVIWAHEDAPKVDAVDPSVAYATTQVLEGVITNGNAKNARPRVDQPLAGKTGTSQNVRDLWFVGYTPQLSTAVWAGYRQEAPIVFNGREANGRDLNQPVFKAYYEKVLAGVPRENFKAAPAPSYTKSSEQLKHLAIPEKEYEPEELGGVGGSVASLLEAYSNYTITLVEVFDPNVPAGTVISVQNTTTDPENPTMTVIASKGPDPNAVAPDPAPVPEPVPTPQPPTTPPAQPDPPTQPDPPAQPDPQPDPAPDPQPDPAPDPQPDPPAPDPAPPATGAGG